MQRLAVPVILGLVSLSPLHPQTVSAQTGLTQVQRAAITDSVRKFTEAVFAAGNHRDLNRLFSYYSPATSLLIDGKAKDWKQHQAEGRAFYATLRSAELRPLAHEIEVLTPTVALWRGEYAYTFTDTAGQVIKGASANTWVLQRGGRGWQIVHVHISDPLPEAGRVR